MKIGFANQAFPHIVPQVLAKPSATPQFDSTDEKNGWEVDEDEVHERIAQRYRLSRRKPPPNIYQSVFIGGLLHSSNYLYCLLSCLVNKLQ